MLKVLIIIGTRPEAIKMAPVIIELKKHPDLFETKVCATAQHREMLDQVLNLFQIAPDYDLNIMTEGHNLFEVTSRALTGVGHVLREERADVVLVQGDTTTSFVGSLAAYYLKIPVGHIEAGLRTYDKFNPFPEEKNRHLTGVLADYHFAPTEWAKSNLLRENILEDRIWVTGNTVIDALMIVVSDQRSAVRQKKLNKYFREKWNLIVPTDTEANVDADTNNSKLILVTGHRRESFGEDFKNICLALREIAQRNRRVTIVYPVHLNPNIKKPAYEILGSKQFNQPNIFLIAPLDYESFVYLMSKSYLVLTDSGGIQEEAPSLGKPVLVMRNTTERPEGIEAGTAKLIGTKKEGIVQAVEKLLNDNHVYNSMAKQKNPYGDGKAAERIVYILKDLLH